MAKYEYMSVRISPTLREQLQAEADAKGIRPTELIRWLIVNACERGGRTRGPKEEMSNAVRR
jgi:hypothetical protein